MKNKYFWVLIAIAVIFFAVISYILQLPANATTPLFLNGDPASYWDAAKLFYTEGCKPHALRPFFYPFLIGFTPFLDASETTSLWVAIGLNIGCWLGTIAFIYKILINHTNAKIAFIGAFIFVSNTSNIINCWSVLAESLFHFLIMGTIYFLLKYLSNKSLINKYKSIYFITFISFFSLALITRPIYSPLIFILFPLFIWAIVKRYLSLSLAAISLLIFLSTVGFNAYKMRHTYGNWTLSYIGECALYVFYGAYAKVATPQKSVKQTGDDWFIEYQKRNKEIPRYNDSIPWTAFRSIIKNDLLQQLKDNKIGLSIAFVRDVSSNSYASNGDVLLLTDFKNNSRLNFYQKSIFWWGRLQNICNSLVALFIIPFFVLRFRTYFFQKNRLVFWILVINSSISIYTILASAVSFSQGDRFHLVVLCLSIVSLGLLVKILRGLNFQIME
jgi:hypothetical protein